MEIVNVVKSVEGKFGPQLLDDKNNYYSFGKFFKGPTAVEPGGYSMDLFVSEKGNRYINKMSAIGHDVAVVTAKAAAPKAVKAVRKAVAPDMAAAPVVVKGRDFDKENRGKTKCALLEALLSNPNVTSSLDLDLDTVQALVDKLVDYVFA